MRAGKCGCRRIQLLDDDHMPARALTTRILRWLLIAYRSRNDDPYQRL